MNRALVVLCIAAFLVILVLNVVPLFWTANPSTYIQQDMVEGMAVQYRGKLFTLNFEQQTKAIDIFNRAIPVGQLQTSKDNLAVDFEEIQIYRFKQPTVVITPLAWIDQNLMFQAPLWSPNNLLEVSQDELYKLINQSYDKQPYH